MRLILMLAQNLLVLVLSFLLYRANDRVDRAQDQTERAIVVISEYGATIDAYKTAVVTKDSLLNVMFDLSARQSRWIKDHCEYKP